MNQTIIGKEPQEILFDQTTELDSIFYKIDDDLMETLAKLFSIESKHPKGQKMYFQNILIPSLFKNYPNIKEEFSELIDNLYIISEQIKPKKIFTNEFTNSSIHYVQFKNDLNDQSGEISIKLTSKCQNKEAYLQVIPEGVLHLHDLQIILNGKLIKKDQLYFNSYIKVPDKFETIEIVLRGCPHKMIFLQLLFYKKVSQKHIKDYFRTKLNIPHEITNGKAIIQHKDHQFKLSKLISFNSQRYSLTCPICHEETEYFYFGNACTENDILNYILTDNDEALIKQISLFNNDHVYISKYKLPHILRNFPTLISLTCFFDSFNCFNALLNYYSSFSQEDFIHKTDMNERTPLHFACFGGNIEIIKKLISLSENIESQDSFGLKPIHYAAMGGQIKVLEFFNEQKYNMFDYENEEQESPFHIACKFGFLDIVKYYVQCIIPQIYKNYNEFLLCCCQNKITPLHTACLNGQEEILKYFISNEDIAKIQFDFHRTQTPLFLAVKSGNAFCVKELLNSHQIYSPSPIQITKSFNIAIENGYLDIVKLFIRKYDITIYIYSILSAINNHYYKTAEFLINRYEPKDQKEYDEITFFKERILSNQNNYQDNEIEIINSETESESEEYYEIIESENDDTNNPNEVNNDIASDEPNNPNEVNDDIASDETNINETERLATDPNGLQNSNAAKSTSLPMPLISQNYFMPHAYTSLPFIEEEPANIEFDSINHIEIIPRNQNPSSFDYFKHFDTNGPKSFTDLFSFSFQTKDEVKTATRNISIIDQRSIYISKSEINRLVYKCRYCTFSLTWKCIDGTWICINDSFINHTCEVIAENMPRFRANDIDRAIHSLNLTGENENTSFTILNNLFGATVTSRCLRSRIAKSQVFQIKNYWKVIPSYLRNVILNGGLADLHITENNEVYCFSMLPNYAKLLLSSKAVLPVVIIDGTFQSSIYRGVIIIAMIVSSNRTNIPIAWAWGPSENNETIEMLLNLIHQVNNGIETFISDEGAALKSAIKAIFPNANHKLCAWHLAKLINDANLRKLFWKLVKADHPLIFRCILSEIAEKFEDELPSEIQNSKLDSFATYFEGVKSNGLKTSSPCESINSEIKHLKNNPPLIVFHFLEVLGFSRCLDLLELNSDMTPYFVKRKLYLLQKVQRMKILDEDKYSTHRSIVDLAYENAQIRWEVDTRDFYCCCGKYTDRCYPCAHILKALQDQNKPIESCIHQCYYTKTIKEALKNVNRPVPLTFLEEDENLLEPPAHVKQCKSTRYLFGFERTSNK